MQQPAAPQPGAPAPPRRLAYAEALGTLQSMFPTLQGDVIAMVLELNVSSRWRASFLARFVLADPGTFIYS